MTTPVSYDAIFADLLIEEPLGEPVAPPPALRDAVLASIGGGLARGLTARVATFFDLSASRVDEILGQIARASADPWVDYFVPGVRLLHFDGGLRHAGADCGLVFVGAGRRFPLHRHVGDEWVFVLSGAAEEEGTGERWEPGDILYRAENTAHAFRVLGDEPFVFGVVIRGLEYPEEG